VNCNSGDSLADEQATANGKEQVLKALGEATTRIRQKLGESLASVRKYNVPAESVTTPSLDALQAYSLGHQAAIGRDDWTVAIQFYERAINLDPNFAMAYARLGAAYGAVGEWVRGAESIRKAYTLRDRVSEREKLYIASRYDMYVTGNLDSAHKTNELWAQTYPQEYLAYLALYGMYDALGDPDKAVAALKEALRLNPASAVEYSNLVGEYISLGRLNDARATAKEARERNLDSPDTHRFLYLADFLQHDPVAMEHDAAFSMGKPGDEDWMLYVESNTAAYGGQFAKARELSRRAVESALRAEGKEAAAAYEADAAIREAIVGNMATAKQQAQRAIALSHGKYVLGQAAFAMALAGDAMQALSLVDDLEKRFPEDTLVHL
jgi:tetratricopeptide (TPR) repeat protein